MPKKKEGAEVRFSDKIAYIPDREKKFLTEDQTRHIYKMIEMDKPVNIHTIKKEIEDDRMIRDKSKEEENESELNPFQMAILNKKSKDDAKTEQMINWSIFSDRIKYVDGSFCSSITPSLTIQLLDDKRYKRLYNSLKTDETLIPDIIFDEDKIRDTYLDEYDGIQAEISQVTKFDESTDLSTT